MRIACAQILSGTDPAANLTLVADYTRRAAYAGARLVIFPEATMCRFGVPLAPIAEPIDGRWADAVRGLAGDAGITVFAGMFTPTGDGRVTNTLLATGAGVEARYDKIHLYDAFGFAESATVAPGRTPVERMYAMDAFHSTTPTTCRASRPRISAGSACGRASTLLTTGIRGACSVARASASVSRSTAGCMSTV